MHMPTFMYWYFYIQTKKDFISFFFPKLQSLLNQNSKHSTVGACICFFLFSTLFYKDELTHPFGQTSKTNRQEKRKGKAVNKTVIKNLYKLTLISMAGVI